MPGKEEDMNTMILSLNKIVERHFDAMPEIHSKQGFDCACLYIDKISRNTEEDIV